MRQNQSGYSLLELLAVLIVIAFLIYRGFEVYLDKIDQAQEKTLIFQAKQFYAHGPQFKMRYLL